MILLLQVFAVVLTVLGIVTLYLGNDPSMLSLGNTLMIVGAISAVGGLLLFGLAVIAARLDTLARGIDGLKFGLAPPPAFAPSVAPAAPHADLGIAPAVEPAFDAAVPLTASVEPYRAEPTPADDVPREPVQTELARIEPVSAGPRPVEPAGVEPVPAPPVAPSPAAPPVAAPATPAIEFPKRPASFRDRFGWKPAAAAAGVAAGAAVIAAKPEQTGTDPSPVSSEPAAGQIHEAAEATEAPGTKEASAKDPAAASGDALEAAIGGVVADLQASVAAPPVVAPVVVAPPAPPRHVEDDDLMARLRASILGPEPAPEPASREPEAGRAAGPAAPELAEQAGETAQVPVAEPAKAAKFSIEDELEMALKAALGRDVAPPAADRRDRFVPPPVVSPPEPPVERAPPPSGDHAMAALARDFPELGDILTPSENSGRQGREPGDQVVTGQDADDVHDSQALAADTETGRQGEESQPAAAPAPAVEAPPVVVPRPEPAAAVEVAPVVQAEPAAAPATTAPLLREGVIAGIPFRLFGDGSIEADLATGTARFASLKDFRAHVGG